MADQLKALIMTADKLNQTFDLIAYNAPHETRA